ncbi:hypothetical protein AAMO2058_000350500 [Amorphochlora amoebiformis]
MREDAAADASGKADGARTRRNFQGIKSFRKRQLAAAAMRSNAKSTAPSSPMTLSLHSSRSVSSSLARGAIPGLTAAVATRCGPAVRRAVIASAQVSGLLGPRTLHRSAIVATETATSAGEAVSTAGGPGQLAGMLALLLLLVFVVLWSTGP